MEAARRTNRISHDEGHGDGKSIEANQAEAASSRDDPGNQSRRSCDQEPAIRGTAPGKGSTRSRVYDPSIHLSAEIHFKYILDGFDKDWTDAGNRRTAYYTNIPPGNYTFRVIASNDGKEWSRTEGVITLVLKPHFYQTLIFKLISGLTVAWLCWICVFGFGSGDWRRVSKNWSRSLRRGPAHSVRVNSSSGSWPKIFAKFSG